MEYQMTSLNVSFNFPSKRSKLRFAFGIRYKPWRHWHPFCLCHLWGRWHKQTIDPRSGDRDRGLNRSKCRGTFDLLGCNQRRYSVLGKIMGRFGGQRYVALRGDLEAQKDLHPIQGFANSCEMIEALAASGDFNIRVGAYPHKHPEAASLKNDVTGSSARLMPVPAKQSLNSFEADDFSASVIYAINQALPRPSPGICPLKTGPAPKRLRNAWCKSPIGWTQHFKPRC